VLTAPPSTAKSYLPRTTHSAEVTSSWGRKPVELGIGVSFSLTFSDAATRVGNFIRGAVDALIFSDIASAITGGIPGGQPPIASAIHPMPLSIAIHALPVASASHPIPIGIAR